MISYKGTLAKVAQRYNFLILSPRVIVQDLEEAGTGGHVLPQAQAIQVTDLPQFFCVSLPFLKPTVPLLN